MFEFLTRHLKQAKEAAGDDTPVTVRDYFVHCAIAVQQALMDIALGIAGLIHAVFPWCFGFGLIDVQINNLKRLQNSLPDLPVWDRIEFKDQ